MKPKVYIAGPLSCGDVAQNVRQAIRAGNAIAEAGGVPFVPHLSHFADLLCSHDHGFWLEQDIEWLRCCNALVRLPGTSLGADQEVAEAKERGIPVFRTLAACLLWVHDHV